MKTCEDLIEGEKVEISKCLQEKKIDDNLMQKENYKPHFSELIMILFFMISACLVVREFLEIKNEYSINVMQSIVYMVHYFSYMTGFMFLIKLVYNLNAFFKAKVQLSQPVAVAVVSVILFAMPSFLSVAQNTSFASGG